MSKKQKGVEFYQIAKMCGTMFRLRTLISPTTIGSRS